MKFSYLSTFLVTVAIVACNPKCPAPVPAVAKTWDTLGYIGRLGPETSSNLIDENWPTITDPTYPEVSAGMWTHGGGFVRNRFIIAPDFSFIPQDAIIDNAYITFYATNNATSENVVSGQYNNYSDNAFYIEKIATSWNKKTVNWRNQPATTVENRVAVPDLGDGNLGSGMISIGPMVQDMVSHPHRNYGFMIKLQDDSTQSYRRILFASNYHSDMTLRPVLTINYRKKIDAK